MLTGELLLFIAAWRTSHIFQTFSLITNYTLILWGGFLFLMQMHGYEHSANAEEFMTVSTAPVQAADASKTNELKKQEWQDIITVSIPV